VLFPTVVPDRAKGPGTTAFIAERTGQTFNLVNEKDRRQRCGQCEEKAAHVVIKQALFLNGLSIFVCW